MAKRKVWDLAANKEVLDRSKCHEIIESFDPQYGVLKREIDIKCLDEKEKTNSFYEKGIASLLFLALIHPLLKLIIR